MVRQKLAKLKAIQKMDIEIDEIEADLRAEADAEGNNANVRATLYTQKKLGHARYQEITAEYRMTRELEMLTTADAKWCRDITQPFQG